MAHEAPARPVRRGLDSAWNAAGLYLAIVVAITWPVAAGLAHDLPSDLGDPVFIAWALARASAHWTALLGGDLDAATRFWDANIFHPAATTGAYSEHFAGHALLMLPAWWLTGNVLVGYNLLFLASAVLSGVGMYLLVRDLTGQGGAAFVAGLCFACAPYRVGAASHLQVLSAQWMPLALVALRRHVLHGGWKPLAGAVAAIWLQNLSSGYYMLFFAPLCGLWSACWLWASGQWANVRRVGALALAGVATLLLTLPFAWPYLALQRRMGGARRSYDELAGYSADLGAWLTASPHSNLWGWVQVFPRAEGELFPGLALPSLALVGAFGAFRRSASRTDRVAVGFAVAVGLFAVWMALGPRPTALGRPWPVPAIFAAAYEHVPGFDVARVPARFQMILLVAACVAAGIGARALGGRPGLVAMLGVLAVLDGAALPFPRGIVWAPTAGLQPPPGRLFPMAPPRVYTFLATLDREAAVVHFPFGASEHDLRYMFYSAAHRAAMVNGYSGVFPPHWPAAVAALSTPVDTLDAAWEFLRANGVTHAVVHHDVWLDDTGERLARALADRGARLAFRDGADAVYQLPFTSAAKANGR